MLQFLTLLTSLLIFLTGMYVLAKGDWSKLKLKYAPVAISTVTGGWLFVYMLAHTYEQGHTAVVSYQLTGIARNVAFVLFHIAVGRDSIRLKKHDRRSTC